MSLPRFHCPLPLTAGTTIALPADAFHHAVRVRRLRIDDALLLFSGDGTEALANIVAIRRDGADVVIAGVDTVDRESPLDVTLIQGISSGDRMDYTLQKAVELGIHNIVPIATLRSMPLSGARADKRAAHWQQVVISACEQSGRTRIPDVQPVTKLADALARGAIGVGDAPGAGAATCRVLLSESGSSRLSALPRPAGPIAIVAGPEGGLTDAEENAAVDAGFIAVTLGPRTLRTETAAVAALAAIQSLWGDG